MYTQEEREFAGGQQSGETAGEAAQSTSQHTGQHSSQATGADTGPSAHQTTGEQTGDPQSEQESSRESQALIDELNVLGAKFAEAIDAAWKSEQRKRLEEDLRTGIVGVAQSLEQHLKEFSRREETKKVLDKAEDVADKVRSSKVSQEVATALTQGLRSLSEHLDKLAHDLREREARTQAGETAEEPSGQSAAATETPHPAATDSTGGQDIPIDRG